MLSGEFSTRLSETFKASGHLPGGPIGCDDQSRSRIMSAALPPPAMNAIDLDETSDMRGDLVLFARLRPTSC